MKSEENRDSRPLAPDDLFRVFAAQGIEYVLYHHPAVFTVAESENIDFEIPGAHCRNLFLRDKRKKMYLVVAQYETKLDLKKLPDVLGCERLSFGSSDRLWDYLGVTPGSVCPFSIINDRAGAVTIILDASMMRHDIVNYHPLLNTMTVGIKPEDLIRFIESTGHKPHIVDLTPAAPDEEK